MKPLIIYASSLFFLVGACSSDDHSHSHTSTYESCTAIINACHPVDHGTGLAFECHELGHNPNATEAMCAARKVECVNACNAIGDAGADSAKTDAMLHDGMGDGMHMHDAMGDGMHMHDGM